MTEMSQVSSPEFSVSAPSTPIIITLQPPIWPRSFSDPDLVMEQNPTHQQGASQSNIEEQF